MIMKSRKTILIATLFVYLALPLVAWSCYGKCNLYRTWAADDDDYNPQCIRRIVIGYISLPLWLAVFEDD
jgi:hypothetical protein